MPRAGDLSETVLRINPKSKTETQESDPSGNPTGIPAGTAGGASGGSALNNMAGNHPNPNEVPVLPPFLNPNRNNTYELPEYDGRRFHRGHGPPAAIEKNIPDYYYDDDFFRPVTSLSRVNHNQGHGTKEVNDESPAVIAGDIIGIQDVCGNRKLWKMLIAEFLGTMFLVLVGCGTCIGGWTEGYKPTIVQISLCFGITVATLAQAVGHVSGANLNPAVTVGLLVCGKCSILKALFYIGAQCLGGICGSAILQVITPVELQGNLGLTSISDKLDTVQGLFAEALVTFVLVLTVCGVCDDLRKDVKGSAPLAIGLSITACHLMAIPYTGSSMNPARSLGPAVITKIWTDHWVYWAGPLAGGFVAGFLYNVAFQEVPPKTGRAEIKNGGGNHYSRSHESGA